VAAVKCLIDLRCKVFCHVDIGWKIVFKTLSAGVNELMKIAAATTASRLSCCLRFGIQSYRKQSAVERY